MRILILFASHYGQTRAIAERLAQRVRERQHEVELVDVAEAGGAAPPPTEFDAIAIGSRVEIGKHARTIRDYLRRHRDALADRPTVFFSVSMAASHAAGSADPEGYLEKLFAEVGWRPVRAVALAGGLPYRKYGWVTRFVLKQISKRAGGTTDTSRNHVLTDWDRVDALGAELALLAEARAAAVPHTAT